jgi:pimeloyl-ACP methyl ester carboxylesterase
MYGWLTRWLMGEGDGRPIAEPRHEVERPEDLAVFPDEKRPKGFLFPPSLAAREARSLLAKWDKYQPDHPEEWESTAVHLRDRLRQEVLGDTPEAPRPAAEAGPTTPIVLHPEPEMPLPALYRAKAGAAGRSPACVLLHLDGKAAALKHPLAGALLDRGWAVLAPDLRGTGETRPERDAVAGAPDHNSAEHALWVGRPLLGQWVFDVQCLLDWLAMQPTLDPGRLAVVGLGPAGVVALCAAGLLDDRVAAAAAVDGPASLVTEQAYPAGTRLGLLAPGLFKVGDVPQLAAMVAPRRLVIAGGVSGQGQALAEAALREAYGFTARIYRVHGAAAKLTVAAAVKPEDIAARL